MSLKEFKTKKNSGDSTYVGIPSDMQKALSGKTINEAIRLGLLTSLGDEAGNLFLVSENGTRFAIVNGYRVGCSKWVQDAEASKIIEDLGNMKFGTYMSQERWKDGEVNPNGDFVEVFRLTKPSVGLALSVDKEGVNINQAVEAEDAVA